MSHDLLHVVTRILEIIEENIHLFKPESIDKLDEATKLLDNLRVSRTLLTGE
jgi:hypothetical protein